MASTEPAIEVVLALVGGRRPATEGVDWQRAAELLTTHGLGGLAVATHRSEPFLPATVAAGLEEAYLRTALHTTLTVEAGRRAHRALLEREIPALLFKGAALVDQGVYDDPGARAMGDADLLVRPDRLGVAVEALRSAGLEPWAPWNPGRADWVDAATFTDLEVAPGVDVTVDLHWRLGYSGLRYGGSDREHDLWNGADLVRGAPDAAAHLVVLLEHLLKHLHVAPHVSGMADIARLSTRIRDWAPVWRRIEERPTSAALFLLLDVLRREVGAPVPPEVGHFAGAGLWRRAARRQLDLGRILAPSGEADGGADGRVSGLLLRWAVLGSPRAVLGEVLHTVLPERRWLRARYDAPEARPFRLLLRYWGDVALWLRGVGTSPVSPNQEFGVRSGVVESAPRGSGRTLAFGVSAGGGEIHVRLSEPGLAHRVSALFPDYRKERLDEGGCAFRVELVGPDGDGNRRLLAPGRLLGTPRADGSEREEEDMEGMGRVAVRGETEALAVLEAVLARGLLHLDSGRVHLHAAGVEVGGRGLVALGPSGAGKSSLALACALDGHRLLGDDVVGVDGSGSAWPFRRLLKVDVARLRAVGMSPTSTVAWSEGSSEAWFDPRAAGGWSAGGVSVRAVVLLERRTPGKVAAHADEAGGPGGAKLSRMHPAEALNVLLASIMPTGLSPEESVDPLLALLDGCRAYRLSFRSTRRAASLLVDLLEGVPAGGANPEPREDP